MKIAIAQQNYHIGNFEYNREKIIAAIEKAKADGVDLIVFSELSVCGYPPRDFLEFDHFISKCYQSIEIIRKHTIGIGVIIGSPQRNPVPKGKTYSIPLFFFTIVKSLELLINPCFQPTMFLTNTAISNQRTNGR